MEPGPTYVLIIAMVIIGVLASFIIYMNTDNSNIPLIIGGLISLAGLAYGVKVKQDAEVAP